MDQGAAVAVRFQHVSKCFELNRSTDRTFMELLVRPFRRRRPKELFWPLRDISFELPKGRTLGIIGENGAGKSTILKLIARILEPTAGEIQAIGRVSALLELGASFHPELTGRENVFLAASIANIPHSNVRRHLEEIIEFADIGPYIDVPVKHYSSGMYVRLGFAVAIHLQPDILLVDEVLAVGDEAFQHKCLQSIQSLQRRGVTIVLVSHSMQQVEDTCDVALWLHDGYVRSLGAPPQVVADYLATSSAEEQGERATQWATEAPREQPETITRFERGAPSPDAQRWGNRAILIQGARLLGLDGRPASTFSPGEPMRIEFDYVAREPVLRLPAFGIAIYRSDQVWCYGTNTGLDGVLFEKGLPPLGTISVEMPVLQLLQGDYTLDVAVHDQQEDIAYDYIREAARFYVRNSKGDHGVFRPEVHWSLRAIPEKVLS